MFTLADIQRAYNALCLPLDLFNYFPRRGKSIRIVLLSGSPPKKVVKIEVRTVESHIREGNIGPANKLSMQHLFDRLAFAESRQQGEYTLGLLVMREQSPMHPSQSSPAPFQQ